MIVSESILVRDIPRRLIKLARYTAAILSTQTDYTRSR